MPDAVKDYAHEIICTSEREKFIIPIKCIGARGIIDITDVVEFGDCAVKTGKSKTIYVRNIGNDTARFSLSTSEGEVKNIIIGIKSCHIHVNNMT
jgi:hydrocephalus-inducing protein